MTRVFAFMLAVSPLILLTAVEGEISAQAGRLNAEDPPTTIELHDREEPIKAVRRFILEQHNFYKKYFNKWEVYFYQVMNEKKVDINIFRLRYLVEIYANKTRDVVEEFQNESLPGAYLTDGDNRFINRLLKKNKKELRKLKEQLKSNRQQNDTKFKETQNLFRRVKPENAHSSKENLLALSNEDILRIVEKVKNAMIKDGKVELWRKYSQLDEGYIEEHQSDFLVDYIREPIRDVLGGKTRSLEEPLRLLLEQAFTAYPFNKIYLALKRTGINAYVTERELEKLNRKIIVYLKSYQHEIEGFLRKAENALAAGDKTTARHFFQKAANLGSSEAHFSLAYKFGNSPEQLAYHFSEAAKQGHQEALDNALDALFFRAANLRIANPRKALEVYRLAIRANPAIRTSRNIDTIEKCIEPGVFDAETFLDTYGIAQVHDTADIPYYVWELAEEAANGERFGKPDVELVLHLVCRGGLVPLETEVAVSSSHAQWKDGTTPRFILCDYITSRFGMGYCADRKEKGADVFERQLRGLARNMELGAQRALRVAFDAATQFIEEKASREEGHCGSGRVHWMLRSISNQKSEYLDFIENVLTGFERSVTKSFEEADRQLNITYQALMENLKTEPSNGPIARSRLKHSQYCYSITEEGVKSVQRFWITYRDASAKLFAKIGPSIPKGVWLTWLTELRTEQLKEIQVHHRT